MTIPATGSATGTPLWEYRLAHWPAASRMALDSRLTRSRIPHEWRGTSVFVPSSFQAQTDLVIAGMSTVEAPRLPPAGWYPDPWALSPARWWDGTNWTGFVVTAPTPIRSWIPPRDSREGALRGGVIALVGIVAAFALSAGGRLLVEQLGGSKNNLEALVVGQLGLWLALFVACKVAVVRHGTGSLRDLGLGGFSWRQIGLGALVGVITRFLAGALAIALYELFPGNYWRQSAAPGDAIHRNWLSITVLTLILVVGAPFFEELFFRGLVQGAFTSRTGARIALFGQALVFGAMHYQISMNLAQATVTVVTISVCGAILGSLRWHTEKLGAGMVAHGVFNGIAALVLFTLA